MRARDMDVRSPPNNAASFSSSLEETLVGSCTLCDFKAFISHLLSESHIAGERRKREL